MANFHYEEDRTVKTSKRIEKIMQDTHRKIFAGEGSVLVLDIYEALMKRDKDQIIEHLVKDLAADDMKDETLLELKKRQMALLISLSEKTLTDKLLDIEKSFSILHGSMMLIQDAKNKDEVVHCVLAGIMQYIKYMDKRVKNTGHYLIQSVKELIHRKLNSKINIAVLAKELGTSSSYLSRLFHLKEGITMQEYICRERISQAEKLLQFSSFTNEEISRCVGFTSISYFGRVLKENTGLTPGQYRHKYRNNKTFI